MRGAQIAPGKDVTDQQPRCTRRHTPVLIPTIPRSSFRRSASCRLS